MNVHMYAHPVVRENIARLRRLGYTILEPACGPLACGYEGKGRMPEPEEIFAFVDDVLQGRTVLPIPNAGGIPSSPASAAPEGDSFFAGKVVLLTVGATQEPVDPVRFLSNRSSGKMGFALAEAALRRGARVVVVAGATSVPPPPGVEVRRALRAEDMLRTVEELFPEADVFIAAAAVADYRPKVVAPQKIKKGSPLVLELEPTPDILLEMGKRRRSDQVLVGFAAETEDLEENARDKLVRKNLDFLVLNEVSRAGVGFEADENEVVLYDRWGEDSRFPARTSVLWPTSFWRRSPHVSPPCVDPRDESSPSEVCVLRLPAVPRGGGRFFSPRNRGRRWPPCGEWRKPRRERGSCRSRAGRGLRRRSGSPSARRRRRRGRPPLSRERRPHLPCVERPEAG